MIVAMRVPDESSLRWSTALGLAVLAAGLGMVWAAQGAIGGMTIGLLRSLDMLSPASYSTGTSIAAEPALWLLAFLYTLPLIFCLAFVSLFSLTRVPGEGWSARRSVDLAVVGLAAFATMAIVVFAFDPSRTYHQPLVQRWGELSYEAADVVLAAATVMVVMWGVSMTIAVFAPSRTAKLVGCALSFAVLTPALGVLFA